jgi:hypothetical protein
LLLSLPLLAFLALFTALWRARSGLGWRDTLLTTAPLWGVLLAGLTEADSAVRALNAPGLALGWLVVTLLAGLLAWRRPARPLPRPSWPTGWERVGLALGLAGLGAIVLGTGLIAVVGWPNAADGMIYHLTRVAYWLQYGSVELFPTHSTRQLYNPPWAEYGLLQAAVLAGDERAGNLVQWLSMLGCLVGVSLVAAQLGADWRGQLGAALFCATLPMGILQASSVQNDYVLAFWLVCLVVALLAEPTTPWRWQRAWSGGASLGLAVLTKGTAYFFAAPLLVLLLIRLRFGWARLAGQAALVGALALALNAPAYWRNTEVLGGPLGIRSPPSLLQSGEAETTTTALRPTVSKIGPAFLFANLVRNIALHLGSPIPGANLTVETAIRSLFDRLGLDPSDPGSTWKSLPFGVPPTVPDEGFAGNTLQQLLIGVASLALLATWRRQDRRLLALAAAITLGFGLFSLLLKWQPYGSRLMLPLFVLWAAVMGGLVQPLPGRLLALLLTPLLIWSGPFVLTNRAHPLIGPSTVWTMPRVEQYFFWRRADLPAAVGALRFVQQQRCQEVGLLHDDGAYEYPFLVLLLGLPPAGGQVQPVGITNRSLPLVERRPAEFAPCAVIDQRTQPTGDLRLAGRGYRPGWAGGKIRVLVPTD